MKYIVTVTRKVSQTIEIEVEADNEGQATWRAQLDAPNHDFAGKETDSDYEVDGVKEKK